MVTCLNHVDGANVGRLGVRPRGWGVGGGRGGGVEQGRKGLKLSHSLVGSLVPHLQSFTWPSHFSTL